MLTLPFPLQSCPGQCEQNKECVLCKAFQGGDKTAEACADNCTHVEVVDHVEGEMGRRQLGDVCELY